MPSGGSVSTLSFSSSHPLYPVDGTSITRVVFVIARGRDTEGRDTERRNGDGSQERVKDGKKISKARGLAAADSRANCPGNPRDFVVTLARGCVSLTPHETFRIPINSRHSGVVNFRE